jgi:hypothetical protein
MKLIARLLLIMVGTAAYLGLAILGWGGFADFFCHPALVGLSVDRLIRLNPLPSCPPQQEIDDRSRSQYPRSIRSIDGHNSLKISPLVAAAC